MAEEKALDIVKSVFEHRLQQADMDRILGELSKSDRDSLVTKVGELLEHTSALVEIAGPVQNVDDVIHVRVRELLPLHPKAPRSALPSGHDYR